MSASTEFIVNSSGTRLALWHFPATSTKAFGPVDSGFSASKTGAPSSVPVILAHGTFSNHRACRGIAQYLSKRGYDCWILDFQGHGSSEKPVAEPDFESMCLEDVTAVLRFMEDRGFPSVYWIGHSGGGLAALMYLARNTDRQDRILKLITLGSQATHAARRTKNRALIWISKHITRLLGVAPGRYLKIGPENEFARVMLQWYEWSLSASWRGSDGFDYEQALSSIEVPILSFSGAGDTFIAPTDGCRHLFDSYGASEKTFYYCATSTGFSENYTHARLVSSSSAAREIWPKIADWLQA